MLKGKKDSLLLAVLFVILYNLSFYPFNLSLLAPISFFLILNFAEKCRSKILIKGILLFYPFYAFHTFWILHLETDPGVEKYLIIGLLFLPLYLSLYPALFFVSAKRFSRDKYAFLILPSLWVVLEYLKSIGPLGFPWMNLYYSQMGNSAFASLAFLGGPYLISYITVLTGYLLFRVYKIPDTRNVLILMSFIFTTVIAGTITQKKLDRLKSNNPTIRVAILQPNILPRNIYDPREWTQTKDSLLALARKVQKDSVELIVLSESAIPGYFRYSFRAYKLMDTLEQITGASILFGTQDKRKVEDRYRIFNTAMLFSHGHIVDFYDKHHLVPFGEWLPYQDKFPGPLKKINLGWGDFWPGKIKPITFKNHRLGVLICFESIFPEISRKLAKMEAELLLVITNDGWFGKSLGPMEHFEMARLRAIETGRYVVRSAKTGVSAIITPSGKIVRKIPLFTKGFIVYDVPLIKTKTPYTRVGDLIVYLSLLIVLVFLVYNKRYTVKERRHN